MTFAEVEAVIGEALPPSAFKHRAWWSNNPSNSVVTYAWLAAGFETSRVDMGSQKLVFRRASQGSRGVAEAPQPFRGQGLIARLQAQLGGTVRFAPGFDATAPTGEEWTAAD